MQVNRRSRLSQMMIRCRSEREFNCKSEEGQMKIRKSLNAGQKEAKLKSKDSQMEVIRSSTASQKKVKCKLERGQL